MLRGVNYQLFLLVDIDPDQNLGRQICARPFSNTLGTNDDPTQRGRNQHLQGWTNILCSQQLAILWLEPLQSTRGMQTCKVLLSWIHGKIEASASCKAYCWGSPSMVITSNRPPSSGHVNRETQFHAASSLLWVQKLASKWTGWAQQGNPLVSRLVNFDAYNGHRINEPVVDPPTSPTMNAMRPAVGLPLSRRRGWESEPVTPKEPLGKSSSMVVMDKRLVNNGWS